ncbi:YhcH/YjgK/YiaL family protein [Paenibacillus sp. FSL K6-2524]|uniref:YhcH/YjgK/YiaL family protein n=1 Tax=Paenibacillus sp. FSL K6-2524 TaxID=2954516 RepID=UPI0030F92237
MILSSLSSWEHDRKVEHPIIVEAIEELQNIIKDHPAPGRVEIRGNEMYAIVMELDAKSLDEQVAENHESYIDVQYLIEGEEIYGWSPLREGIEPTKPYDSEGDITFYNPQNDEILLPLKPGMFVVFFPHDIHRPCMGTKSTKIKKVVIKIHISLFK